MHLINDITLYSNLLDTKMRRGRGATTIRLSAPAERRGEG